MLGSVVFFVSTVYRTNQELREVGLVLVGWQGYLPGHCWPRQSAPPAREAPSAAAGPWTPATVASQLCGYKSTLCSPSSSPCRAGGQGTGRCPNCSGTPRTPGSRSTGCNVHYSTGELYMHYTTHLCLSSWTQYLLPRTTCSLRGMLSLSTAGSRLGFSSPLYSTICWSPSSSTAQ